MTDLALAPLLSSGTYDLDPDGRAVMRPWSSNAELIAEVMHLHHPAPSLGLVADVTYGRGVWWKRWHQPDVRHGLDVAGSGEFDDGVDFRQLPEADGTFQVVAFDPPYCAQGGRRTTTIRSMKARYGSIELPKDPAGVQTELINPGLTEVHRVLAQGGIVLVKVKNYITGGNLWPGEYLTLAHAATLDMALAAHYVYVTAPGPQPPHRAQVSPRNNTSSLFVLRRTRPVPDPGQPRLLDVDEVAA